MTTAKPILLAGVFAKISRNEKLYERLAMLKFNQKDSKVKKGGLECRFVINMNNGATIRKKERKMEKKNPSRELSLCD